METKALELSEYEIGEPGMTMEVLGARLTWATPNSLVRGRVQSMFEKEPWTIAWINGFAPGEMLVDVGANIGLYSIWAAAYRGARVAAFEPEAQNYALLNRNLRINGLDRQVRAYPLALMDRSGLTEMHLQGTRAGESLHAVGAPLDYKQEPFEARFVQGAVSASLDDLVFSNAIPQPDHIKIDVDGFEHKVIAGALRLLRTRPVKSLQVEINQNLPAHREIVRLLGGLGYRHDSAEVARSERKEGDFAGVADYLFRR